MKALDNKLGEFLAGPIGSVLRVALAATIGLYVAGVQSGHLVPSLSDLRTWLGAAILLVLPVVIAAVNPQDPRFGTTGS